jgi:hypothetical protein
MDSHEIGMGVGVGVGVGVRGSTSEGLVAVGVVAGAGAVDGLGEGIGLEAGLVQLVNTAAVTKKERITDAIVICLIGAPSIQLKARNLPDSAYSTPMITRVQPFP